MAAEAPKRRAQFDDFDDSANKRHRSGSEDDRVKSNGTTSTSTKQHSQDHAHHDSRRGGKSNYKDPFGGSDRLDRNGGGERDAHLSRRRSPAKSPGRDRRRDGRSKSPVRRGHDERNGTRQRSPPRGPRGGRSPDRRRPDERSGRRRDSPAGKPSDRIGAAASKSSESKQTNGDGSTPMAVDTVEDEEEAAMRKILGFAKFRTTKNTKVPGNDKNYGVRKEKKTEYRQYMNRTGGFNRPLSPG